LGHIWLPVLILAIGGTANLIRTLRATLLDELRKQYVTVARAKAYPIEGIEQLPGSHRHQPHCEHLRWLLVGFSPVERSLKSC
jgi:hypothetical protein